MPFLHRHYSIASRREDVRKVRYDPLLRSWKAAGAIYGLQGEQKHIQERQVQSYTHDNERKPGAINRKEHSMKQQLETLSPETATVGTSNDVMVEVRDLKKSYHQKTVVNNVSFAIRQGEIFGVLGPNGPGKTTTPQMIQPIPTPASLTA